MTPFRFHVAILLMFYSVIEIESAPVMTCVKADEDKKWCPRNDFPEAFKYCKSYPSRHSRETRSENSDEIISMCCHKECTLRFIMENYCADPHDFYEPCVQITNDIKQDEDKIVKKQAEMETAHAEPIHKRHEQQSSDSKSATQARPPTEVGLSVKFFRGPKCHCKRIIHNRNHHRFGHNNRRRQQRRRPSLNTAQHAKRHIDSTSKHTDKCHKNHDKAQLHIKRRKCRCRRRTARPKV